MYGQTEATARMAYLPPRAGRVPPGRDRRRRSRRVVAAGAASRTGPSRTSASSSTPAPTSCSATPRAPRTSRWAATVDELRTGDIARRTADGLYEIVGRRSRFVKIFGLRVDLDRVERDARRGTVSTACCVGRDDELLVAVAASPDAAAVAARWSPTECGLPRARRARPRRSPSCPGCPPASPTTRPSGHCAGPRPPASRVPPRRRRRGDRLGGAVPLYAEVLERADVTEDSSFVSLRRRLAVVRRDVAAARSRASATCRADWHVMPIRGPARHRPPATGAACRRALETSVACAPSAIVLIVGTHIDAVHLPGGAHVLLGVAGFNFARFQLTSPRARAVPERWRSIVAHRRAERRSGSALVVARHRRLRAGQRLRCSTGRRSATARTRRHFWFIEALVYILLVASRRPGRPRRGPAGAPLPVRLRLVLLGARAGHPVRRARARRHRTGISRPAPCSGCSRWAGRPPGGHARQRLLVTVGGAGDRPRLLRRPRSAKRRHRRARAAGLGAQRAEPGRAQPRGRRCWRAARCTST